MTVSSLLQSRATRVQTHHYPHLSRLSGAGAVNAKFQDGAGGTDLTGLKYLAAAGGSASGPFNPAGWFETSPGTLLNLNLSGAVAVGGELVYMEVG